MQRDVDNGLGGCLSVRGRPRGCGEVMKLELMMSHNLEASPCVRGLARLLF